MDLKLKKWTVLFSTLILIIGIIGGTGGLAQGKVTLSFANWLSAEDAFITGVGNILEAFEKEHPDIEIKLESIPYASLRDQLVLRIASGDAPDIVLLPIDFPPVYASMGALMDLSPLYTEDFKSRFYPGSIKSVTFRGKQIGVSMWSTTYTMYYNTELFDRAGIAKAPQTWEEYRAIAEKTTFKDTRIYGAGIQTGGFNLTITDLPWFFQAGCTLLDENYEVTVDSEGGVQALTFLVDLTKEGLVPPGSPGIREIRRLFGEGKVAMWEDGPWMRGILRAESPGFTAYSTALLPKGTREANVYLGGIMTITKQTKDFEASKKFLLSWLTDYSQNEIYKMLGAPSVRSMWAKVAEGDTLMTLVKQGLETAYDSFPGVPEWPQIKKVFEDELIAAFTGDKTPKGALDDAARIIRAILGDKYK
jgi:multiple sugar transport system substrate-binding protein